MWPSRYAAKDPRGRYVRTDKAALVPTPLANRIARNPQLIANQTYADRNGNGPTASGDGWRYRGRGLLQVTGRGNYRAAGVGIGQPLEAQPELLEQAEFAALSAAWWWLDRGLNELADVARLEEMTRLLNGGLIGLEDRLRLWKGALEVLQGSFSSR